MHHFTDPEQSTVHIPVLSDQVIELLQPRPGQTILDGTLGGGGHTRLLAERVQPGGRVIALDLDIDAVDRARRTLAELPVTVVQQNYCQAAAVLAMLQSERVDAVLLDLGLSSDQLQAGDRGFSFLREGALDMRFDRSRGQPAWQLLATLPERELADVIYRFGEERYSRRIAKAIVTQRSRQAIKSTRQLADIVRRCVPVRGRRRIDPATRTFQALRIAVNDELASLEQFLGLLPEIVADGGRVAIISFQSLEDRLVKNAFRRLEGFEMITRKPVRPSDDEVRQNSRARSARLRVVARSSHDPVREDLRKR